MELEGHDALGGERRLRRRCPTPYSASSRARISFIAAWCGSSPSAGPAPTGEEPRRHPSHRQEDVPAEGHRRRPSRLGAGQSVPRRRPFVRSASAQPRNRPAEEGAGAGAQARAVRQGQGRRHHRHRHAGATETKTKALREGFAKLGLANALIIDGAEVGTQVRARRAQHSRISTCCRSPASTSTTCCAATPWC